MEADDAVPLLHQCPPEHREWVHRLRHGGPIPLSSIQDTAPNTWACPPGNVFSLRGADYMKTKAKIPGGEWLLQALALDVLQGPCQIAHIMNHPQCRIRAALDTAVRAYPQCQHQPFVWAFNFQLGTKAHHSLVYYYVSFGSPSQGSLMQRFLDGDDGFRNSRLKLLFRLPQAPRIVQVAVGERWSVCMLGKVLTCTYTREKHYIEVDVNVGSSMLSSTAVKVTFGLAPLVVSEMAFVLEGSHPDELPERILGAIRHVKVQPSSATHIDMREVLQGDVLRSHKLLPKGIFKAKFMKPSMSSVNDSRAEFKYKRHANGEEEDEG